jgi:cysteine-rich repeat protein
VTRITIVDVVAGNARRRRNLLDASTQVTFEVEPSPMIQLDTTSITVLENVGTLSLQLTRSVNIMGECGVFYSVVNQTSDNAVPRVNFVPKTGFILFASTEVTKHISVEILSEAGFRAEDVQLTLVLSDVENATVGERQAAVITVRNVHMPAPAAPVRASAGTSKTGLMVSWSPVTWAHAPTSAFNKTLAWDLECRHPDVVPTSFRNIPVPFVAWSSVNFGGLSTYRRVQCRLRVQSAGGWSLWSPVSSDMYTLPDCGDGARQGDEQCDDAGTSAGDGCSGMHVM